jgi:hypothetical protein
MIRGFACALCLMVPTIAAADLETDTAALTAAIEAAGCVVNAENGDAVLAAAGLDEASVTAAVGALYEAGLLTAEADGSAKLHTEACP